MITVPLFLAAAVAESVHLGQYTIVVHCRCTAVGSVTGIAASLLILHVHGTLDFNL